MAHGLLPAGGERGDARRHGIPPVVTDLVADLGPEVVADGGVQVVGRPSSRHGRLGRFLEQGLVAEGEGVVHGDPLSPEHGEGVAEAGGLLDVVVSEGDAPSGFQVD
jgi:hypothetical protein